MSDNHIPGAALRRTRKLRVLIVEDDVSVGELCHRILETEGYSCALARTLEAARESIAGRSIDLVLADVMLPGGSGRELADEMQIAAIPVLYMSGHYEALCELATAGVAHLRKPFRLPELVSRVGEALAPRRPAPLPV